MPSAGELLRTEREKRSRSLAEISDATRITRRYLEALEADDVKALPGEFFYKAFIRQYAGALDLDAATTNRILSSAVPVTEPDPLPVLKEVYENAQNGESTRWRPSTAVAVAALLLVLAGASALYAVWQRLQNQREAAAIASETGRTAPSGEVSQVTRSRGVDAPSGQGVAGSPATTAVSPAPASQEGPPPPPPASAAPTGGGSLEIAAAAEPVWVQLSSEGRVVFVGTLDPSQARQFAVGSSAKLLTGNAGALVVSYNGQSIGPIGPRGQVRTVLFSPEGAQVVAPQPKVPVSVVPEGQ